MRWMNRLATAVIVSAVVAGPLLLAAAWLLHHPWQPPTRAQLQAWAAQPVTAGTIIAACAAVAGLAWLLLLIHLTRRALAGLRRRLYRMRHLAVPTPAQMTASSMAGIAAFTLPATPADHPQRPPETTGTPQLTGRAGTDHDIDRPSQDQPPGSPCRAAAGSRTPRPPRSLRSPPQRGSSAAGHTGPTPADPAITTTTRTCNRYPTPSTPSPPPSPTWQPDPTANRHRCGHRNSPTAYSC